MRRLTRRWAIAAGAGLSFALAGAAVAAPDAVDMSLGAPRAPVQVVEYASLSCGHCARFHTQVFPALKARYIDTGKVRFTLREFLTPPEQVAAAGFLMARCAGRSRYFKVVDEVFRSQPRWEQGDVRGVFVGIAKANGLSEAQFEACITDKAALAALDARMRRAVETDHVQGTPTFFIDGKPLGNPGVPTLAELEAAIATALKAKGRR